jgi:transposase
METLNMSRKERNRLTVMGQVKHSKLSLRDAAEVMVLSYRQAKRVWRRYKRKGDAGLVHGLRGRPSARRKAPRLRAKILARYQSRYADFGPTLAAEYLRREDGLEVDHDTLRRWLVAEGLWQARRRRQQHRQWRERKACLGQMVQLDGSHHDWFEGRRAKAVLMVMVDDATNKTGARFLEEETTRASFETFDGWVEEYGVPCSVYVDRDSIYRCERAATVAEQVADQEPQTQFGRAMSLLGVELILANSPQAKGRVERRNGLLQDRLVKALRLRDISDLDGANSYLEQEFLRELNGQFTVAPASPADVHRPAPGNLREVLSWEEARVVQRDWTVAWENAWYQIDRRHEGMSLAGKSVVVRRLLDGSEQLIYRGQKLLWRKLPGRPERPPQRPEPSQPKGDATPAAEHPWRGLGGAVGKEYWKTVRKQGRLERAQRTAADSGRPSLRSGLPPSAAVRPKKEQRQRLSRKGHSLVS